MTIEELRDVLETAGVTGILLRSQNLVFGCPFAAVSGHRDAVDAHPSLGFRPVDGEQGAVWNCFTCGRKGTVRHFLRLMERELGADVERAETLLDAILRSDAAQAVRSIPPWEAHFAAPPPLPYPVFPEEWLETYRGRTHRSLIEERGLRIETLRRYEVGWDKEAGRAVYPVRDAEGRLVGAVGGLVFRERGGPKYKNYWHRIHARCGKPLAHRDGKFLCPECGGETQADEVRSGFRKSLFLYGEWLRGGRDVVPVVVEGIVDCLKTAQALPDGSPFFPVALLGAKASREQVERLVALAGETRTVVLFFDNDPAGREGDRELADALRRRLRCFRAAYPPDRKGADPGALPEDEIRRAVEEARLLLRGGTEEGKVRKTCNML